MRTVCRPDRTLETYPASAASFRVGLAGVQTDSILDAGRPYLISDRFSSLDLGPAAFRPSRAALEMESLR